MSSPADEIDESAFGAGGESSVDADRDAAVDNIIAGIGAHSADEARENSHVSDIEAAYDDPSKVPFDH